MIDVSLLQSLDLSDQKEGSRVVHESGGLEHQKHTMYAGRSQIR